MGHKPEFGLFGKHKDSEAAEYAVKELLSQDTQVDSLGYTVPGDKEENWNKYKAWATFRPQNLFVDGLVDWDCGASEPANRREASWMLRLHGASRARAARAAALSMKKVESVAASLFQSEATSEGPFRVSVNRQGVTGGDSKRPRPKGEGDRAVNDWKWWLTLKRQELQEKNQGRERDAEKTRELRARVAGQSAKSVEAVAPTSVRSTRPFSPTSSRSRASLFQSEATSEGPFKVSVDRQGVTGGDSKRPERFKERPRPKGEGDRAVNDWKWWLTLKRQELQEKKEGRERDA